MALLGISCGVGNVPPSTFPLESTWTSVLRQENAASTPTTRFRGALFTMRIEKENSHGTWIHCPLEVPYRFEPLTPRSLQIDIDNVNLLLHVFPESSEELRAFISSGNTLEIQYEVVGRFVVDTPSPRAASIICPAATHHVRSIAVGAYQVSWGATVVGKNEVVIGGVRKDTLGRMSDCKSSDSPREGCLAPLAYDLIALPVVQGATDPQTPYSAGPQYEPRPETMPETMPEPVKALQHRKSGDLLASCYPNFESTGDPVQDLDRLTSQCAQRAGMIPHSEVLIGQPSDKNVSHYTMTLEAGHCYQAFGVGSKNVHDLDLGFRDPNGQLIAHDLRPDPWAVVPPAKPLCIDETGKFELIVSFERGRGSFAVQVWRRP